MSQITGGHLAAKYMREIEQVDMVFTLSGGHIENLLDGLNEYGIKTIDVRHEQAAAMMAHAWSIYKNQPGNSHVLSEPIRLLVPAGEGGRADANAPRECMGERSPGRAWRPGSWSYLQGCFTKVGKVIREELPSRLLKC